MAKTSDAPSGLMQGTDASLRRADQLAPLKQGPPADESVPPVGRRQASDHGDELFRDSHERARSHVFCLIPEIVLGVYGGIRVG